MSSVDLPRDENHPDFIGECEGCQAKLFTGDSGLYYRSGEVVCAACTPTWEEAKKDWAHAEQDDDGRALFEADLKKHLEAGGSLTDRFIKIL
jgi:hypothetical protein